MKKHLLFILILLLITLFFNLPAVFNINTHISAFFSTDEPHATIWDLWRIKQSCFNSQNLNFTNLINYPFGVALYTSGNMSYLKLGLKFILVVATTPIITWNINILINFFLTALIAYLLVFYLTNDRIVSLFSGIVFSFSPQHFVRSWQHFGLTYFQWMPLLILALILLKEKNTRSRMFFLLLAILLLFSFSYSILYLSVVSLLIFIIYILFYNWRNKLFRNRYQIKKDLYFIGKVAVVFIIGFIILLPQFLPILKGFFNPSSHINVSSFNSYRRPFDDLFTQSAKPLSYLLPSTEHPIFGGFTEHFVGSHLWGVSYTEHQLYLGWTVLFLAFYTMRQWKRERKIKNQKSKIKNEGKNDFYIGYFIFLAIAGWLFSQPPWWQLGDIRIYLPSFFMYKILPVYRAYCRFGIVVLFAVSVLAGYGLKFILDKQKTQLRRYLIGGIFCGLILFEFCFNPFTHYIDLSEYPEVYNWLKEEPQNVVVAEYPMPKEGINVKYSFYQTIHHKKLINGATLGMEGYKTKLKILNLGNSKTPSLLKWLGADYIIVHTSSYKESENLKEHKQLRKIRKHPNLKLIRSFSDSIEVYKIRDFY